MIDGMNLEWHPTRDSKPGGTEYADVSSGKWKGRFRVRRVGSRSSACLLSHNGALVSGGFANMAAAKDRAEHLANGGM